MDLPLSGRFNVDNALVAAAVGRGPGRRRGRGGGRAWRRRRWSPGGWRWWAPGAPGGGPGRLRPHAGRPRRGAAGRAGAGRATDGWCACSAAGATATGASARRWARWPPDWPTWSSSPRTTPGRRIRQPSSSRCGPACPGHAEVVVEPDRAGAIRVAVGLARPGDVVLLAGKGHETTQDSGRTVRTLRRPGGGGGGPGRAVRRAGEAAPVISLMTSGGVALWVAVLTTPFLIRWLLKNNIGQQIREDGPQVHIAKAGTPTMGGICIVGAVLVGFLSAHVIPGVTGRARGLLVHVGDRRGGGHRVRRRLDQGAPPPQPRAQQAGEVRLPDGPRRVLLAAGRLLGARLHHALVHPLQLDRAPHGHGRLGGVGHAHHRRRRPTR